VLAIQRGFTTRRFQFPLNINVIKFRWMEHVVCIEQMRNVWPYKLLFGRSQGKYYLGDVSINGWTAGGS
jgi:hypothetical protein